jgi:regulator of sigma E protease
MGFFLYYIVPFIIVLGVLIFFHELGHFLVAKYSGVKVLKFALGFGPKLVSKNIGDTEYSIRYFPLGGFVKMLGEDESDEEAKNLPPEEAKKSFENQSVIKRMAIVAAGPFFNLILAFILFSGLFLISGQHVIIPEIGQVTEGMPAQKAGLQKGDVVVSIDGKAVNTWSEMKDIVQPSAGKSLKITIQRGDKLLTHTIVPQAKVVKNMFGQEIKTALIGIVSSGKVKKMQFGPWEATKTATLETWKWVKLTCLVVVKLFQGSIPLKEVGGPILIGQMAGKLAQDSFANLIPFMAIISVNLAILNLFPIPILDGGLLLFLLFELLIGKPVSPRMRELAMKAGLFLLIFLMLIITFNDLSRFKTFKDLFQSLGRIFG